MSADEHKAEARRLIEELISAKATEEREDEIVERLNQIIPDPEWIDYVFWSKPAMTVDQVVEKSFSYRPIQL